MSIHILSLSRDYESLFQKVMNISDTNSGIESALQEIFIHLKEYLAGDIKAEEIYHYWLYDNYPVGDFHPSENEISSSIEIIDCLIQDVCTQLETYLPYVFRSDYLTFVFERYLPGGSILIRRTPIPRGHDTSSEMDQFSL